MTNSAAESVHGTSESRRGARRWLRFSLLSVLVVMTLWGAHLAHYAEEYRAYVRDQDRLVPTEFDINSGQNLLWQAKVGNAAYGGPVVSGGKVFVGTNNQAGYLPRYPATTDLGVLLCFDAADGAFLWQASSEKLKTGRDHDWPLQGICSTPTVEGNRIWYVTNRCEIVCLDTEGFRDREDDGEAAPVEIANRPEEADVVWRLDMMSELGVVPSHMSASTVCLAGDLLFAVTGNGGDTGHVNAPAPNAPSFIAVDKHTGRVRWQDSSPGHNILDGQYGSPIFAVLGGTPQVLFPGGDGWLYSFAAEGTNDGKGKLLWKFDCNPKDSKWILGGRGTRNSLMHAATAYRDRVYILVGQDPEHGEGVGHVWCIDPTKRGDLSPEIVFNQQDPQQPIPHKRLQAAKKEAGDFTRPNPNSGVIWHYTGTDLDGNGTLAFEEEMHRSLSRIVIKNDLALFTDFSGLLHCVDINTGNARWTYDMFAASWASPVISAKHVFVIDEDGDVAAFRLSADADIAMPNGQPVSNSSIAMSSYATPTIHKNIMYILARGELYAISSPKISK